MKDVSQTFPLIITSKFEEDGLCRGIQVYTVLFWKATLLLEGVFSEISPFFSLNIAVNLKNDFKCELSSMILHNLVPIDPGNKIAKKKKKTANVQCIASTKTFFSIVREQIIIRRQLSAMT